MLGKVYPYLAQCWANTTQIVFRVCAGVCLLILLLICVLLKCFIKLISFYLTFSLLILPVFCWLVCFVEFCLLLWRCCIVLIYLLHCTLHSCLFLHACVTLHANPACVHTFASCSSSGFICVLFCMCSRVILLCTHLCLSMYIKKHCHLWLLMFFLCRKQGCVSPAIFMRVVLLRVSVDWLSVSAWPWQSKTTLMPTHTERKRNHPCDRCAWSHVIIFF